VKRSPAGKKPRKTALDEFVAGEVPRKDY
jgi:hypothetical protein